MNTLCAREPERLAEQHAIGDIDENFRRVVRGSRDSKYQMIGNRSVRQRSIRDALRVGQKTQPAAHAYCCNIPVKPISASAVSPALMSVMGARRNAAGTSCSVMRAVSATNMVSKTPKPTPSTTA